MNNTALHIKEKINTQLADKTYKNLPFAIGVYVDGQEFIGSFVYNNTIPYDPQEDVEIDDFGFEEELAYFPVVGVKHIGSSLTFVCKFALDDKHKKPISLEDAILVDLDNFDKFFIELYGKTYQIESYEDSIYFDVVELEDNHKYLTLMYVDTTPVIELDDSSWANWHAKNAWNSEQRDAKAMADADSNTMYECDGAAAGGDAGGVSAGGDAAVGDATSDATGITSGEVLGGHDHNDYAGGFFGPGCFHIPSKVKTPFHRWEICNGGSKRKKGKNGKPKKYAYEKGMKVVVDMFEDEQMLNEWSAWPLEKLKGRSWEDVSATKNPPSYDRWQAAQLPAPEESKHGDLGGCEILADSGPRGYLSEFFIHGHYNDGTLFKVGPMRKKVLSEYINLYKISLADKSYEQLEKNNFSSIKDVNYDSNVHTFDVAKFKDGFYLKAVDSPYRIGPFDSKVLARKYAMKQGLELLKSGRSDHVDAVDHIQYPTFAFSYTMAGVPCMDIVVAEDMKSAMKLFDFQWRIFDNSRPVKAIFNTIDDLTRDLSILRIKDIEIEELDGNNVNDYVELAQMTGNPSTIPSLKSRNRNPKFKYILGRDSKTGRSPITIRW